jgi:hypothetical protein
MRDRATGTCTRIDSSATPSDLVVTTDPSTPGNPTSASASGDPSTPTNRHIVATRASYAQTAPCKYLASER